MAPKVTIVRAMKKRITEDAVRRLRPGGLLMCTAVIGFGVRKSPKTKRVRFFVRRVVGGTDHRLTLGTHHELSVRAARKLAMSRILEIERTAVSARAQGVIEPARGELSRPAVADPRMDEVLSLLRSRGAVEAERPAVLTLGELWERVGPGWLAGVKPKTQKNIRCLFDSRILPRWSATPVDQIRNQNLTRWYQSFLESAPHYGAEATRKIIRLLRLGHEQELVEALPVFKVKYVRPKRRKPLEQQAICKLVEVLEDILSRERLHSNANAIISIMNTGERARAGLQLHTREVNYAQKCITKSRKFDQVKSIPISDYAVTFLRSIHPPGGGFYFPNRRDPSRPIKYAALLAFLKSLCSKHRIYAVDGSVPTIHSMRHTYATLLEEQGLPVSHIQRLLGHSSIQSTLRYIHGNGSAAREGANRLEVTRVRRPG